MLFFILYPSNFVCTCWCQCQKGVNVFVIEVLEQTPPLPANVIELTPLRLCKTTTTTTTTESYRLHKSRIYGRVVIILN